MACSRLFGVLLVVLSVVFICNASVSASAFASASASASISISASDQAALAASVLEVRSQLSHLTQSILNAAHMGISSAHSSIAAVSLLKHVALPHSHSHSQPQSGFHSLAMPSATCVSAVLQLNATAYSSNCQSYLNILNSATLTHPSPSLASQVTTMCQSTCLQLLANAAATVAVQCQSADAAAFTKDISQTIALSNLLCTKDPNNANNYCLAEFFNSVAPLQSSSSITAASLQAFCSPCTFIILNGLVNYGGFDFVTAKNIAALSTICSIDPVTNQFCFVEFFSATQALQSNPTQLTNKDIEPICSPCARKFLDATGAFDAYCAMNGNDFCIVKDFNRAQQLASSLGNQPTQEQLCSALANFANGVGCCLTSLVNITYAGGSNSGLGLATVLTMCGISIPAQCTGVVSYTGTFSFVISNLAVSYYEANIAAVNAVIISDLAMNLGVPVSAVSVSSVLAFNSNGETTGVQVTITVIFTSSLQSTTALGLFKRNSQNGNFPLTSIAQLGASSRIVPFAPVAVSSSNTQASSNAPIYSSPATQQAPLAIGIILAAAVITMLFTLKN